VKDILINCGYPLIERFPLMVFTSAGVLLIGLVRWYLGMATRTGAADTIETDADTGTRGGGIAAKIASLFSRDSADQAEKKPARSSRRTHAVGQAKSARAASRARPTKRSAPTRSRHARPPLDEQPDPTVERRRRRRPTHARDLDAAEPPATPRRRPRPPRDPDLRGQPPREIRRDPHGRSSRPTTRTSRFDPYEPLDAYDPPPRRRTTSNAGSGTGATHHPISRVRYRAAGGNEESDAAPETRSSRTPKSAAESWEYDI
ncbi:MAG TPA: DUF6542 domain-containing protein, partial [Mycobacterium sp.]